MKQTIFFYEKIVQIKHAPSEELGIQEILKLFTTKELEFEYNRLYMRFPVHYDKNGKLSEESKRRIAEALFICYQ